MFNQKDKKHFLFYSFLSFLFFYPLIQAGVYYRDDLDRAITGQYGWKSLGRPVADLMMRIFSSSGRENLDLFPYTLLFSCFFIAASALLLKKHLEAAQVRYATFSASLLIFNPFMLQNIAYRFDSVGMAFSMMLAVASYTLHSKQFHPLAERLIKIAAGILALSIYQPCANIFIGLMAIDLAIFCTRNEQSPRDKIRHILTKIVDFIIYYGLYVLLVAKIWKHHNTRANTLSFDISGLETVVSTSKQLFAMVSSFLYGPVIVYFAIPLLVSIPFALYKISKYKDHRYLNVLFLIFSFLLLIVSLPGPNIILREAPIFPRTLVSFSTFFVVLAILLDSSTLKKRYLVLIPVITVFAFSAQLSNTLKAQSEHDDMVFNIITQDLLKSGELKTITIIGEMNISPRAAILVKNKPLLNYFLSPACGFVASYQLINKGFLQTTHGYDQKQEERIIEGINIAHNSKPQITNQEYRIYISGNNAVVALGTKQKTENSTAMKCSGS